MASHNEWKIRLILVTASLSLTLFSSELYLQWRPPPAVYVNQRNIVQQTHSEPHPTLGYLPKANLRKPFYNKEFNTMIAINSQHMRDATYPLAKNSGIKRIVALGDSFTFGWGVQQNETYVKILERHYLKNVEILNMGVSGYAANQMLEWLQLQGLSFEPDIVFLASDDPTANPPQVTFKDGIMYWASVADTSLKTSIRRFLLKRVALFTLYQEFRSRLDGGGKERLPRRSPSEEDAAHCADAPQSLHRFRTLADQHSFVPVFIYIPDKSEIDDEDGHANSDDVFKPDRMCNLEGIRLVNLIPLLQQYRRTTKNNVYFKYDDHWNRFGHQATARSLNDFLKRNQLLPEAYFR